jgi:hypothetical protein
MSLDHSAFQYLKPTENQLLNMDQARQAVTDYAAKLEILVPDGPDKTYLFRKLREVSMWAMVAITREANGSSRE